MFGKRLIKTFNRRLTAFRNISSNHVVFSAQSSPLFILRQKTGIAYSLCREALNKHNNDVNEAEAWLKAQALAHGLQKATKVRGRTTSEGLIGLAIHNNYKMATVIELNCETDFVAKNQIFKDLAIDLTHQVATTLHENCLTKEPFVEKVSLTEKELKEFDNLIVPIITKLGENIKINKATHFKITNNQANLYGQTHSQTGHKVTDHYELISGRFGAIVALENLDELNKNRSLKVFGNRLCQHVIGFSPTYIELPDNIRKHLEEAEEKRKVKNEIKDSETTDKNRDSDEEYNEEQNNRDDWPSIMDQQIIMSDNQTVRDFCKENKISIIHFDRFECD